MKNPSATHQNVEDTLRSIIVSLIDAQKGFQRLGENLKDEMFKKYFLWESLKRAAFRGQLEAVLHQEGMRDIVEGGTLGGAISRMWASLQAKLHEGKGVATHPGLHAGASDVGASPALLPLGQDVGDL